MKRAINLGNMRLLLILILSILIFICNICLWQSSGAVSFALPDELSQVTVESKTVHRGQTFSIDVELSNNQGLIQLLLSLDYDSSAMTLKGVTRGDALESLTMTHTGVDTELGYSIKPFNVLWDGREQDNSNGLLVTFIFDSYADAPVGDYPVTITYDEENTKSEYDTPTDISITSGVVHLVTGEYQAIYRDWDGTILYEKDYNADDVPSYPSSLDYPSREEDAEYSYEFVGFKGVVSEDINVLIFEADYLLTPQTYRVFYYVDGVNGYPDGVLDEVDDYFTVVEYAFGSPLDTPLVPERQYYHFFGWYEDKGFQIPTEYITMPSRDLRLYGYYTFDVRDRNIPVISLENVSISDDFEEVVVTAKIVKNTGFNGLVLTLDYDRDVLSFEGFDRLDVLSSMQFDTTSTTDLSVDPFKFYYESATNNYETGDFLILYFTVKPDASQGIYMVNFTYDFHKDATYYDANNEIRYTKIDFTYGEVPVGAINHWLATVDDGRTIDVTSRDDKPINVRLEVELSDDEVDIDDDYVANIVGKGMAVSSAYNIRLLQNRKEIQPNTTLTIKIELNEKERKREIKFYYLNDDDELVSYDFRVEDGYLVFTTDHLSNWVIFASHTKSLSSSSNGLFLIGMPIMLAIATMLYVLRLKQKITKIKKETHND